MKYFPYNQYFFKALLLSLLSLNIFSLSLYAEDQPSLQANTLPKTYFLNISSLDFSEIPPPVGESISNRENADLQILKDAMAARTKRQIARAIKATKDSVFDYSQVLGPKFTKKRLPLTSALFEKVDSDAKLAIHAAKEKFHRKRPSTWMPMNSRDKKGASYAYPSGHSTRSFLWAKLLINIFPKQQKDIILEARQKAWNRVILGRHYPNDVYGGQRYGKYLAKKFLQDPAFQKELDAVKKETKALKIGASTSS